MDRLIAHAPAGHWPSGEAFDRVTLDFDSRHRRRIRLTGDGGRKFLLDLSQAVAMAEGDGLRLESGDWVSVAAAAEPVTEITCDDRHLLMRIAWHLGNRHLPTQITPDALRIRPDHVISAMVEGLGGHVMNASKPFQPEGGAYGGDHKHGHSHDHAHGQKTPEDEVIEKRRKETGYTYGDSGTHHDQPDEGGEGGEG